MISKKKPKDRNSLRLAQSELVRNQRLRQACAWLEELAKAESERQRWGALAADYIRQPHPLSSAHPILTEECVTKLEEYDKNNLEDGDLMRIRDKPCLFHRQPYDFLWMLHRYQNYYQKL